jgi:hypothetical protein
VKPSLTSVADHHATPILRFGTGRAQGALKQSRENSRSTWVRRYVVVKSADDGESVDRVVVG